jgi:diguanylate cyclase (GGDEF)-like protein
LRPNAVNTQSLAPRDRAHREVTTHCCGGNSRGVNLERRHAVTDTTVHVILDPARSPAPAQSPLLWQSTIRLIAGLLAGGATLLALRLGDVSGSGTLVLACTVGYLTLVAIIHAVVRRARETPAAAIAVMLLADLLFIFGLVAAGSPPAYYDRSLILSFLVLHLTAFYFGPLYGYGVTGAVAVGYLALVHAAVQRGASLQWADELWSVGAFALIGSLFVGQHGEMRARVGRIVTLFERGESGDFSQEYDVTADRGSDALTTLGRAYNRLRAQVERMVLTDPLTGCLNRRGFDQALGREVARSSRAGSELTLLAIDLDHFKRLNDRCGHHAGDVILRELAELLRQSARAGDVVCRTGGEEFTLILPDTNADGGFHLASRLCDRIRNRDFVINDRTVRITISVGVAAIVGGTIDRQAQELRLRADQALYAAKRLGRDRVLIWTA